MSYPSSPMSLLVLITTLSCCSIPFIGAQQPYAAKTTTKCSDKSGSALGYSCNGPNTTCHAYLTLRATPRYDTVSSISALLGSDPSELSSINSVPKNATFESDKLVIVPVKCSCSGSGDQYYYQVNSFLNLGSTSNHLTHCVVWQVNSSYVVEAADTPFLIANNTFQGLSTCQALRAQNGNLSTRNIYVGDRLVIPLRCACPTKNQSDAGYKYLLSYLVASGDYVSAISARFGGNTGSTLAANELTEESSTIYPFTTLLVPIKSQPSSSQTVASPPPPSPISFTSASPSGGKSSSKSWVYAFVGVVCGVGVIGAIIFFVYFRRSKKKDPEPVVAKVSGDFEAQEKQLGKKLDKELPEFLEELSSIAQSIKVYSLEELKAATDNFSPGCWIKGSVYRGLINGDFAAIKKIDGDVSKEISMLNKVSHFNVIRLSGVCFEEGHWYLVFEYAANGTLKDWIYQDSLYGKVLSWKQRVQIGLDVATGLNYLHNFINPPCVHKNIKSSNILLDSDFRGKIANLALARLADGFDGEFALTRHIVGTKGYMAPEYLENGLVSTKLDVYAFGILLLGMIAGKEVLSLYEEHTTSLSDMIHNLLSENGMESLRQFIDPSLEGNYPLELAVLLLRLINGCLHKNQADRPTMDEVVQSITRIFTTSVAWESTNTISEYQN